MKKRYLKRQIEIILIIVLSIQLLMLIAEPTVNQFINYVLFQIVNIPLLIVNIYVLDKYGKMIRG